jgi:HlyD family secretion protein
MTLKKPKRWQLVAAGVVVLAFVGWRFRGRNTEVKYTTAVVDRGDVVETVGATGSLQAVVTVQVGSQVSGTIQELKADFNSVVTKGKVIARLDPSSFEARVAQARANVITAQANVEKARAAIEDTQQKYERAKTLAAQELLPATDLETAQSNYESATAGLQAARASVTQAQASLEQAQVDLEHTIITAPIDGVVIARNVDVGQTVAASFQAPVLFVIANDLSQMQVNASIDEADIGKVQPAQEVTFRVDAYPDRTFTGRVRQVRLQPTTVQNVVSYNTIITVKNDDLRLMPGMTASVSVIVRKRENVVRVASAALRFRPAGGQGWGGAGGAGGREARPQPEGAAARAAASGTSGTATPAGPAASAERGGGRREGREGRGARGTDGAGAEGGRRAIVFTPTEKGPQAVRITTGATDGQYVEVVDGLAEGTTIITGIEGAPGAAGNRGPQGSNPFSPQFQRRQR